MVTVTDRLDVRNFPEGIKEWAERRNINMSEETRRLWRQRMDSPNAGMAAIRSELAEKRAALDAAEARVGDLRDEVERLEAKIDVLDETPDSLDAELREKAVLIPGTPAVERIAADHGVSTDTVLDRHAELHDTGGNNVHADAD